RDSPVAYKHTKRNWSQRAISYSQKVKGCLLKTGKSKAAPDGQESHGGLIEPGGIGIGQAYATVEEPPVPRE
ncbi:MAG: hypothetical protein QGH23_05140, partial [Dehalococcoidia bacterium]|nr:hypothetical protein [Dehalococcoidia bacterium]